MRTKILFIALAVFASLALAGCMSPGKNALDKSQKTEAAQEKLLVEDGGTPTAQSSKDREAEGVGEAGGGDTGSAASDDDPRDEAGGSKGKGDKGAGTGAAAVDVSDAKFDPQREAFGSTCGGCHTLADAGASGTVGPDLDDTTWSVQQIDDQIVNGGGAMPPGLLTGADATAMAEYVAAAAAAAQK